MRSGSRGATAERVRLLLSGFLPLACSVLAGGCSTDRDETADPPPISNDGGTSDASTESDAGMDANADASCEPVTCLKVGAECGTITDGCGLSIACGQCTGGLECGGAGPNRCGTTPCFARSCTQLQAACGLISDGCSGVLDCGGCAFPQTCGGGGTANECGCDPEACGGTYFSGRRFGDQLAQHGNGVALDGAGNTIVVGGFKGDIDFGGGTLTSAGGDDLFVVKFDIQGSHVWSRRYGDAAEQGAWAVETDSMGNIIVAGGFDGTVSFGSLTATAAGDGQPDLFLLKLDQNGDPIWLYHVEAPGYQVLAGVAVDAEGNAVAVGEAKGVMNFGGGPLGTQGDWNAFAVKVDASGSHLWSRSYGEEGYQGAWRVDLDPAGNVFVIGSIWGPTDFGEGPVACAGEGDGFLLALDPSGNFRWSRVFGDAGDQYGVDTAVDSLGDVVLTFRYEGTVNLGGNDLASHAVLGESGVAKFNASGQHLWSKRLFNTGTERHDFQAAIDSNGHVVLAGATDSSVDFGGGTLPVQGDSLVVAELDAAGVQVWSKAFGAAEARVIPNDLVVSPQRRLIITGTVEGEVDFGGGAISSSGTTDVFLLELSQ